MIQIQGTGKFLPKYVLTNQHLESIVETSDEWITKRTGIKQRRVVTDESVAHMAIQASLQALENAKCDAKDIDLVVCSTIGGDYIVPSVACLVAGHLKLTIPAMDINAACSGFVYALDVVVSYLNSGRADKVLLIGVDNLSRFVDFGNRNTCVLFGDGAGALIVTRGEQLKAIKLTTKGGGELMNIPNSEGNAPFTHKYNLQPYLYMDGPEVYKWAIKAIDEEVRAVLSMANLSISQVDWFLPHQANYRIIETASKSLGLDLKQVLSNIEFCGNTSSACLPSLLHDAYMDSQLKLGDIVAICSFGGGLTTGAAVLKI
ncbi:MAG: ketoacyl-ACP synthase III [Firmicutes bacterium]|nr:ketoacyl-ACP synthase III [Bacillota bacterium]